MQLRETNIDRLENDEFDIFIVGAGINGAVSAAALSARGCRVAVIDRGDFACETSQESSNLVWGGIKYLENQEFPLVWNLCKSRNRLMRAYPTNIREIRFFSTLEKSFRFPPWFIYIGTWVYWIMGRFFTQTPRYLTQKRIKEEEPSINSERFCGGIEYSDAYLVDNDARFVHGFVRQALNTGACVSNYVELIDAQKTSEGWELSLKSVLTGRQFKSKAKVLINAAGPYVDRINQVTQMKSGHKLVFSRGIHLIFPQITKVQRVLTFFDETGRMFFVIPMGPRSVVGTTDTRVKEPETAVTEEDREFLLRNVNARLNLDKPLVKEDIIAERCGVRPLVVEKTNKNSDKEEWFSLSRKHVVEVDQNSLSIYGGKLTDCLNIGEEVCDAVIHMGVALEKEEGNWFGEPAPEIAKAFFRQARLMRLDELRENPQHELLSTRLWRRYGLRAFSMLEAIRRDPSMDDVLIEGAEYLRCELYHAAQSEMIIKLEDFLRRRSKIALVVPHEEIKNAKGIHEACRILFGAYAEDKFNEYFDK